MRISDWSSDVCSSDLAARIRPSRLRLQFRDDLACADLGRARDGPGGKACEQRIQGVLGRIKPPDHIRYTMHDMAIEFDDIAVRPCNSARFRPPSPLVPAKVEARKSVG